MFARVICWVAMGLFLAQAGPAPGPLDSKAKVLALVFVSSECPVSNKMAPQIERLHKKFSKEGAELWTVYPNASDTEKLIKQHRKDYRLSSPYVRDAKHELVKKTGVTITPEAVVFNEKREIVYKGRINDQFLALGKGRPEPTEHNLEDAIEATLAGRAPKEARTEAVGCYIQNQK